MKNDSLKFKIIFTIIFFGGILFLPKISLAATINAASCEQATIQAAINQVAIGDTINIPAGNCTWGNGASYLNVNKTIILQGAGRGLTIINISTTAGAYTAGTIRISAPATVRSFTIETPAAGNSGTAFSVSANGFRITDIEYIDRTAGINGYFVYSGAYGLIDNSAITGGSGSMELIFARGPADSWQTPDSIGGADNLFVENNTFSGTGYVGDCNSNSRCVFRYNTITGSMKIDAHGKASNTPPRGVRHIEVYNNLWTSALNYWTAIEIRGGTGTVFENRAESGNSGIWFVLTDYGYTATWPNFNNSCQCPTNYPVDDQIGIGQDPKTAASDPLYSWNNTNGTLAWKLTWRSTSACHATCGAFTLQDVIKENRDYYLNAKPNYVSYACPHPLTDLTGTCDTNIAGIAGYGINNIDTTPPQAPSGLMVD